MSVILCRGQYVEYKTVYIRIASCFFLNSYPSGQNLPHLADDTFESIFVNDKFRISIRISVKFVSKGPIDNKSALVQVMACYPNQCWSSSPTHKCGPRGRWVNVIIIAWDWSLVLIRDACCGFGLHANTWTLGLSEASASTQGLKHVFQWSDNMPDLELTHRPFHQIYTFRS